MLRNRIFRIRSWPVSVVMGLLLAACEPPIPADESSLAVEELAAQLSTNRKLTFEGVYNFRDLGGYQTRDGRTVKSGVLYRSDNLAQLTDSDIQSIGSLNLKRIVDFRSQWERDKEPDRLPEGESIEIVPMPVDFSAPEIKSVGDEFVAAGGKTDAGAFLIEINKALVRDNLGLYKEFVHALAESSNLPLLFHCTSGKDRTGLAAAIVLLALGVPKETVMEDYLLSNRYLVESVTESRLREMASELNVPADSLRPIMGVERRFLEAAFEMMEQQYGSVEKFLRDGLKIDDKLQKRLKDNLLVASH